LDGSEKEVNPAGYSDKIEVADTCKTAKPTRKTGKYKYFAILYKYAVDRGGKEVI